ncbi:Hypothetical predicted protein [Pelobates cultripes]|uniref:Uncharacterized protein n=1 Tax=Pelobates cultripes TaxID=61616 RepID=A0AAD1VZ03_PELCU|nr:Hypothetical predicted protein [Pelobates cultripes]
MDLAVTVFQEQSGQPGHPNRQATVSKVEQCSHVYKLFFSSLRPTAVQGDWWLMPKMTTASLLEKLSILRIQHPQSALTTFVKGFWLNCTSGSHSYRPPSLPSRMAFRGIATPGHSPELQSTYGLPVATSLFTRDTVKTTNRNHLHSYFMQGLALEQDRL